MVKTNLSEIKVQELIADMWSPLNEEQREFLADHFTLQSYKKNEVIHCEGETPTHLMCLLSGKVKIYKDGVGGRSQIIRMIKPVEYFGYRAYFSGEDYITAAAAFEPSVICQIPMSVITTLVTQNNGLAMFFIKQLGKPHSEAYPRPLGRIAPVPQGKLRIGGRRLYTEYLPLARGSSQPFEHDDFERHPNALPVCRRTAHHHRRTKNQNHRRRKAEENQQDWIKKKIG